MHEEFIQCLSGHSGCEISLLKDNSKFFVRKTAGHTSYNGRLRTQIAKQIAFVSDSTNVKSPIVYKTGFKNGIFFFDMQYLNCRTLAKHMETIHIKEITNLVDIFYVHIQSLQCISRIDTNDIFQAKIQSLSQNIPDNPLYVQALSRLANFDFSSVLQSKCHGDLTLENILIDTTNQIYLIDFLDSFFDSWMIDVAKLLQDLELEWSYRHQEISSNLKLRLLVAKEALLEQIQTMPDGNNSIITIYNILLLNVMRIVPYAKDDTTRQWIDNAINKITKILNSKGEQ